MLVNTSNFQYVPKATEVRVSYHIWILMNSCNFQYIAEVGNQE